MSYDKYGIGFAEICQVAMYFPAVYAVVCELLDSDKDLALKLCRKTLDAYKAGMIEKTI